MIFGALFCVARQRALQRVQLLRRSPCAQRLAEPPRLEAFAMAGWTKSNVKPIGMRAILSTGWRLPLTGARIGFRDRDSR